MNLNLARPIATCPISDLHGPGRRFVFWVQGCALRCTRNCINPAALSTEPRHVTPVAAVLDIVLRRCRDDDAEGLTVLGGEPTEQAAGVAEVFEGVQAEGLSTMLYSGHTLEALRAMGSDSIDRLLAASDVIVDGPFIEAQRDEDLLWRGSRNQRILTLSARYDVATLHASPLLRGLDVVLEADGRLHVSGMHQIAAARSVTAALSHIASAPRKAGVTVGSKPHRSK